MRRRPPRENTPRVIFAAALFFGAATVLAWKSGVFALLSTEELAALAIFAAGFALLTYFTDRGVRASVDGAIASLRGRSSRPDRRRGPQAHIRT